MKTGKKPAINSNQIQITFNSPNLDKRNSMPTKPASSPTNGGKIISINSKSHLYKSILNRKME